MSRTQGDGLHKAVSLGQDSEIAERQSYRSWLANRRAEAVVRGGKPISKSQLAAMGEDYRRERNAERLHVTERNPGEIVNPVTGEVVTGCLSIGRLAEGLVVSTIRLTDEMERLGIVQRVLDFKEIPMICHPSARKPFYFHTPEATLHGVEEGFVIPIEVHRDGVLRPLLLVTPKGQELLATVGKRKTAGRIKREENLDAVADLLHAGYSQAAIARMTGLPKQTVSRHVAMLRVTA